MSSPQDRREAPRILSQFSVVLSDEAGATLDDRAVAHDVSDKGFKAETQADLKVGQDARFRLELAGEELRGLGRVVWVQRTDMAVWAGVQFRGLSWADRRRVRRVTSPSDIEWGAIADKAITALLILLFTVIGWSVAENRVWREILPGLLPNALVAVVAGLALREVLRPRR